MTDVFATEGADPMCLSPDTMVRLLRAVPFRRFAVVGDSLSAGVGGPVAGYRHQGWSDRVADALRTAHPAAAYQNTAVVGATTRQVIERQASALLEFGPDLVHVPSAANDLFGTAVDFAAVEADLRELYELATSTGARLTAFTFGRAFEVPRYPDFRERVMTANAITRGLATEFRAIVVDMWAHPVNDRPELVSADGVHFSAVGQAVLAAEVTSALARSITRRNPPR